MSARRLLPPLAALTLALAPPARAAAPAPLDPSTFAFPGALASPATARSAGLALADRWLGEAPYENPASAQPMGFTGTPLFEHVSRQDVSAANRDVTQKSGYLDFGGAALALPWRGWSMTLYAWQPSLRLEGQAYTRGRANVVGPGATVVTEGSLRELRGGGAVSRGFGAWRIGISGEWLHREDSYETIETSGDPLSGDRTLSFSGDGWGGAAGLTYARAPERRFGWALGAAAHVAPALDVSGDGAWRLLVGDTTFSVQATRRTQWTGGASLALTLGPGTRLVLEGGGRGAETWDGFDVATRAGGEWHAGLDWRDPEQPWSARVGAGEEVQPGAPEPRAGAVGVGLGWTDGGTTLDVGILHRTFPRGSSPSSYDDRVLASVRVAF